VTEQRHTWRSPHGKERCSPNFTWPCVTRHGLSVDDVQTDAMCVRSRLVSHLSRTDNHMLVSWACGCSSCALISSWAGPTLLACPLGGASSVTSRDLELVRVGSLSVAFAVGIADIVGDVAPAHPCLHVIRCVAAPL